MGVCLLIQNEVSEIIFQLPRYTIQKVMLEKLISFVDVMNSLWPAHLHNDKVCV